MQNQFLVLQSRSRRNPTTGRTVSFAKGERCNWTKIKKAGYTTVPEFVTPMSEFQVRCLQSNMEIDKANRQGISQDLTPAEVTQVELITEHLLSLGLDPSEFAFGKNLSLVFRNAEGAEETLWVGVKMTKEEDRFIRNTGKAVSLCKGNWISASTFIYRVEKGLPLFVRDEA